MVPPRTAPPSPRYRPPLVVRAAVGAVAIGAVLFTIALMWSDRAPGVLHPVLSDGVRQLWTRIDPQLSTSGVEVTRSDLPRTDSLLHITIWSIVSGLVCVTVWSWRGLAGSVLTLTLMSYAIEIGQGRFSTTRTVDVADAIANTIGIAAGALVAVALYVAWDLVGHILAAIFSPAGSGRRV